MRRSSPGQAAPLVYHAAEMPQGSGEAIAVVRLSAPSDATVTIVHSRTPNSEEVVRRADIVIAACGRMEMVKGSWIKPGAAVRAAPDPSSSRFRAFRERRHRRIDRSTERNRPELN